MSAVDGAAGRLAGVRLLFVVNVDWFFISHRLPLLRAARSEGAEVAVATADTGRLHEIEAEGVTVYPLRMSRAGRSPVEQARSVLEIARAIRGFRPDVVHNVTIKPVLIGTLVTRLLRRRTRIINAISGFGFVMEGGAGGAARRVVRLCYRLLFRSARVTVVVQNDDARRLLVEERIARHDRIELIEGSGVDCDEFAPVDGDDRSDTPVTITMAGRILRDKGVVEYCEAIARLADGRVEAVLAGSLDPEGNPTALRRDELDALCERTGVRYLGDVDDMPSLLGSSDVFVLPSHHEGLPKVLIEAAASGLPLVATDIAGCRPVVHPDVNGELVPVRDVESLAAAIERLAGDPQRRRRYGVASRRLALERFSVSGVVERFVELYAGSRGVA